MIGRFAPSPTGPLHLGNLRTALVAHASVRANGGTFLIRFEDLDMHNANMANAQQQLDDLASLGITADVTPVVQSERFDIYHDAITRLTSSGLTYECFCTRNRSVSLGRTTKNIISKANRRKSLKNSPKQKIPRGEFFVT